MYSLIRPFRTGFSADPLGGEVGCGDPGSVAFVVGDALRDALVRPGRVVVRLISGQDGAQMSLAEDQHTVQDFAAQGADQALAGRVHARRLYSAAQNPGASGLAQGDGLAGDVVVVCWLAAGGCCCHRPRFRDLPPGP